MARVFVEPIGVTLEVAADEDLLAPLVRAAVDIPTDCAGRGTCGKCLVRLGAGELTPPTERELKRVPEKLRADGWRLACQAHALSARVSIEVRATGGRRRILTASKLQHGAAHPAVTTQAVTMDVPTMEDKRSDVARFTRHSAPVASRRAPPMCLCPCSSACRRRCATAAGALWRHVTAAASWTCSRASRRRTCSAPPSMSAPRRSSPTCSTWAAAG